MSYESEATNATLIGFVADLFLSILKTTFGVLFYSTALIADGIHSISDVISDAMVIAGVRIASKPRSEKYPYGLGKVEAVISFLLSIVLVAVAIELVIEAIHKIEHPGTKTTEPVAIVAAIISISVKEFLFRYTYSIGKKLNSPSVVANAFHHRSDSITSIAVLIGIVFVILGYPVFDPIASIVVSGFILYFSYEIGRDSILELIDANVGDPKLFEQLKSIASNVDGIKRLEDIRIRKYGHSYAVECVIVVDASVPVERMMRLKDEFMYMIMERLPEIELINISTEVEHERVTSYIYDEALTAKIKDIVYKYPEVKAVHSVKIEKYRDKIFLSLDLEMDGTLTVRESHDIGETIREELMRELRFDMVRFHIDPYEEGKDVNGRLFLR